MIQLPERAALANGLVIKVKESATAFIRREFGMDEYVFTIGVHPSLPMNTRIRLFLRDKYPGNMVHMLATVMTWEKFIEHFEVVGILPEIKHIIDNGIWSRAAGDCICSKCGYQYDQHINIAEPYQWATLLCDCIIVKL